MGCAPSSPASPLQSKLFSKANVPSPQQQDEIAASLAVLGLERYAPAFHEIGYDDLDTLDGFSQEELLQVARSVGMLQGHAIKWIKSRSGSPISPSKVALALSASGVSASGSEAVHIAEAPEQVTAQAEASSDKDERIVFWCIKADKLRNCDDRVLPRFQDLRRQKPDWFVEVEITLEGACAHEYADYLLAVSHRWEQQGDPDTQGIQLSALCHYVRGRPAILYVWVDFYCAPQKERTPAEELVFGRTLRYIAILFLGSSVLILCDRTYTTRFWTLFEAWLSMQMATVDGLAPALREKRRCDIVPIHHASAVTVSELEALVAGKSLDEIYATLDSPDVSVTNQKDKGQQLAKLLALDSQVRQVLRDMALPSTRIGGTPRLLRDGAGAGTSADAPAPSKDERLQRLVELVRSGSADAAGALADMGDDESRVAIARAGGIVPLVALLSAQDPAAGAEAARALRNLSVDHDENRISIAQAGAIPPLVALLQSGTDGQKENAAFALRTLAVNAENKVTIAQAGAIAPLVVLTQSGTAGQKENAAIVLKNLSANNAENKVAIAKAGGIPPLVALLQSSTDGQKEAALGALNSLSLNAENKVTIAQAGAIAPLVVLTQSGTAGQKETAARVQWNLAVNAENEVAIAKADGIPPLVALLQSGTDGQKEAASGVLNSLSVNDENKVLIAQAGGIPPLEALAQSGTYEQKLQAAHALRNLAMNAENKASIAKSAASADAAVTEVQRAAGGAVLSRLRGELGQLTIELGGALAAFAVGTKVKFRTFSGCTVAGLHANGTVEVHVPGVGLRCGTHSEVSLLDGTPLDLKSVATTTSRIITFHVYSTVGAPELLTTSGVSYYEAVVLEIASVGCAPQLGFATPAFVTGDDAPRNAGAGDDAQSWGLDGVRKKKWGPQEEEQGHVVESAKSSPWACTWAVGDTIGLAANVDLGKMAVSKNGSWTGEGNGIVFTDAAIKQGIYPALTASKLKLRCAFSAADFKYAPPPGDVWQSAAEVRMLELERQLAETKAAMERLAVEREEGHKFRLWPWGA